MVIVPPELEGKIGCMSSPFDKTIGLEYSKLKGAASVTVIEIDAAVLPPELVPVIV